MDKQRGYFPYFFIVLLKRFIFIRIDVIKAEFLSFLLPCLKDNPVSRRLLYQLITIN